MINEVEWTSYDPKALKIDGILDNGDMHFLARNNSYGEQKRNISDLGNFVRKTFNTTLYRPRANKCVLTEISDDYKTSSYPDPFSANCLNDTENSFMTFSLMGVWTILSFFVFLRYSWPFVLEWHGKENFLPFICGDKRGNKRTIGTNVAECDIQRSFIRMENLGVLEKIWFEVKKVTVDDLLENERQIGKRIAEREIYENKANIF